MRPDGSVGLPTGPPENLQSGVKLGTLHHFLNNVLSALFVTESPLVPAGRDKCYLNTDVLTQRLAFITRHGFPLPSVITYFDDKRHFNTIERDNLERFNGV